MQRKEYINSPHEVRNLNPKHEEKRLESRMDTCQIYLTD